MEGKQKFLIHGGYTLEGNIRVSGGKNTSVAVLPAVLLSDDICVLENVPDIEDVRALVKILRSLGATVEYVGNERLRIDPRKAGGTQVDSASAEKLRASYYLVGALLGRCGRDEVAFPGGCNFDDRPFDQHLMGFQALGAETDASEQVIRAEVRGGGSRLTGNDVFFDMVTVGGTINVMLAAVKAQGKTTIYNAAKEPHIVDLANFLNSMGAHIKGAGTDVIRIRGEEHLHGTTYAVIPDQIETGTLMVAAAATRGDVTIHGCIPTHMEALTAKLLEMGARVTDMDDAIRVRFQNAYRPINVKTQVYPGFPTDLQQPMTALLATTPGTSHVQENIFKRRFGHVDPLVHMGAEMEVREQTIIINGVPQLHGAAVEATDLRAGAALLVAGLMAQGITEIHKSELIDRGYEHIERKLNALGAHIEREQPSS